VPGISGSGLSELDAGFSTQLPCRYIRKIIDFFKFTSFMEHKKWYTTSGKVGYCQTVKLLVCYYEEVTGMFKKLIVSQATKKFPTYRAFHNVLRDYKHL
jgi:hypothetical protein